MKRKFATTVALSLFCAQLWAVGVTPVGKVNFLSVEQNGVFVQMQNSSNTLIKTDPDGCGRNWMFMLKNDNPSFESLYSALLAAYASQTEIDLKLDGCNGPKGNTWAKISYVRMGRYIAP